MNHYEKGRHVPDIDTLRRMAAELNVPLNYFFCNDQTTAELALLISRMTEEERSSLIEALKTSSAVFLLGVDSTGQVADQHRQQLGVFAQGCSAYLNHR